MLKYGSGLNGSASQFGAALFIHMACVDVVRVPNNTSGLAAIKDLLIPGKVTPEQLTAKIKAEMAKWGKVIKDVGIRAN